jgi:hypothetical protein
MAKKKVTPYHAESYPLPLGFNGRLAGTYRWFSGRPLNGHRYTDATGFRYGTMATDISGRATAYQLMPGYKRFLYARLPIMVAPGAAAAFLVEPGQASMAGLGLATLGIKELDKWRRTRRFRSWITEPVATGAAAILKVKHAKGQGHTWVHVPEDFRDDEHAKIRINLPPEWIGDPGDKARLVDMVANRLNLDELSPSWSWTNGRHTVDMSVPSKPPPAVSFQDGLDILANVQDTELAMGLGTRGRPEIFSLAMESPHLLIAGGSGAGKSVLLAWLVGQFMRRGYGVAVLDSKFLSHMWLRRVPGVLYASEGQELHEALLWLEDEMFRRARARAKGDMTGFQPLVVVMEEMAGATNRLRQYWNSIKVNGDPQQSPAITAMVNLSSMGRELLMHVLMAGQSLTAKTVGGPENRENFQGRTLARATAAQWRMLAPQIKPAPTKRQKPGRWHLVVGDTLREYQAPFIDLKDETDPNATARLIEWATGGAEMPDVPALLASWLADQGDDEETSLADYARSEAASSGPAGISLRTFAQEQGLSLTTVQNWKARPMAGVPFPVEVGIGANRTHLYDRDHLKDYVRARLREPVTADGE